MYDAQVAVRGKYGPIFIGKTWLGKYDKNGEFTAFDPNQTVAWYFLDFNDTASRNNEKNIGMAAVKDRWILCLMLGTCRPLT